jgi:nucleotide-binding universal stress UspA family protein
MTATANEHPQAARPEAIVRIAVGVDGFDEGRDAVTLGAALAGVTGAELMLVAVHLSPMVPLPHGMDQKSLHQQAEETLIEVREALSPTARIMVESDLSIPRALHRVVHRERRDLVVLGSSRHAPEGRVRMGKRTRQLLCNFECALAVAPRGLHRSDGLNLRTVGVGYDGGPEADAALATAGSIASAAGAELRILGVVDDRVPTLMRSALQGLVATEWHDVMAEEQQRLHDRSRAATKAIDASVDCGVVRGHPGHVLLALSREVDLLVIGSRRWGPAARVLLGSTGEMLMHDAQCPVLAVPRPAS